MNDSYVEILIKKQSRAVHTAIKILLLFITVASFLIAIFTKFTLLFLLGLVLLIVDNLVLPLLSVEFEYLYVGGELAIDRIAGKARRKNCVTADMEQVECIAEDGSQKIKDLGSLKYIEKNYTSGSQNAKIYACILHQGKEIWKILFEPNEDMLDLMRKTYPRKVFK